MIPLILLAVACLIMPQSPCSRILSPSTGRGNLPIPRIAPLISGIPLVLLVPMSVLLSGIVVTATAAWWIRDTRRRRCTVRTADATADMLGRIVADLYSGAGMPDAVRSAVEIQKEDGTAPARVIGLMETAARRAADGPGAGLVLAEADDVPDLAAAGRLWHLSERHGIPLATVLEHAQHRVDARIRHRDRTRAALQGPQASAVILTFLPPVGTVMGTLMGAQPLALLTGGGVGGLILLGGVVLTCTGTIVSRIIVLRAGGEAT
ncbi:hypothetical protein JIM95_005355 [Corynebacterium sp. CCM 8835]|uniref:Type II secretion system protein GspF domain-containing protein n=1 Tax=Corynebacterium antarcticum TaxID=2800405 RepID=A0ABS1FL03_9CORY|nr:hypothetical protein [Corynebacterium antarcticum]MCK7660820.1 hypothetical protein [Corynebacterium antarcticum]MCL0245567.1 hypothetical protein [Corynebacterium antarcticum]MCX7491977.1 hypothetical protein [Corynebacterium antarcticum]MCX7540140.1 hypothetical protein [Corynebacterium antarcticum]